MDSQKIQEIIISTIEEIAKNTVLNTNFLTLINGQISYVDKFNNYYNFTYQKEEYTGFSITGEKYEIGDLVYILKLNNDLTSKQMIISKVNSYANFDIELAINNSLEEIKNSINQIETQDKEISIIGNTVFTLNDDLTITPEELTFSAQKSSNINDIVWYVDGEQQVQDELKKLTISSSMVKNKDSLIIRVEDFNNSEVYDEITVIRAMSSDTKLELDLGLDSILLQKNEQGIIDYSKAILTPKVLSEGEDITSEGWSFNYKIENGAITLVKEQNSYKIINMDSDKGKISFFAIKNGNMYLQKVIYLSVVTYGDYNLNITVSNQNFLISKTDDDKIKENTLSTTIRALKGDKILKIVPDLNIPQIGNAPGKMVVNDDYSVTYSWDLTKETIIDSVNGEIKLLYTIENEQHSSIILWTTVNDGASGAIYRLDINPPNIIKNGDGTFSPNEVIIKSLFNKKGNEVLYDGYFKIYKTIDNKIYTLDYESKIKENTKNYTITDLDLKSLKIDFLDINKKLLITEYCYVNINSSDFIEVTTKTENNETHLTQIDGQIQGLVKKDTEIETNITNLETGTNQKFTEINNQYSEVTQKIDEVTTTVSNHTETIEEINGDLVAQNERLTKAEEKITDEAIINTVTKSESWQQVSDKSDTALENSKAIKLSATSTAFSKTKGSSAFIPSTITITATLKSYSFGKFQYATATNGTYTNVVNGQHGFTLNGTTLTIANSSDLFTATNNTILIKGTVATGTDADIITIVKVSDGKDGTDGSDGSSIEITNTSVTYQVSSSGTTIPTGTWSSTIPTVPAGKYLWTKTTVQYSDGKNTNSYSVSRSPKDGQNGQDGESITITSTSITYQASTNGTTVPSGQWSSTIPSVPNGQFLWTRTIVTYSDGTSTTSYSVSRFGVDGADAYTVIFGNENFSISCSSNGNTASATTVTVPVYTYIGTTKFANSISVGTLPNGMTSQVTNGTSSADGKIVLTIANNSSLGGAKSGTITVNVTVNGKVFAKQISWSKSIAGTNGTNGSPGASGRVYFLEPTTVIIKKGKDNKLNPSNVTFSSYYRDGTSATRTSYLGRFVIQESVDGSSYTTKYTSAANEGSKTYTPTSTAKTIKCTMYAAGGTSTALDTQTVAIVEDIDGIEVGGRNFFLNSNFDETVTISSSAKNPNLYPKYWSAYNGGIQNPTTNYHAHVDDKTFNFNVIEFNETNGIQNWKAISQNLSDRIKNITGDFTISLDTNATLSGTRLYGGFYYTKKGESSANFHSGQFSISGNDIGINSWKRASAVVKLNSDVDFDKPITFYIYGYNFTSNAILYIDKVQLEKGNIATDWTPAPEDIENDLSDVEKRVTSAEQKLTSTQWSLWFTEVVNNSVATSTKFTMDKNGLHIKGGGIDILNNAGTKVFYADGNGNLVINNLTANNGVFNGTINAASGKIGGWNIGTDTIYSDEYSVSTGSDTSSKTKVTLDSKRSGISLQTVEYSGSSTTGHGSLTSLDYNGFSYSSYYNAPGGRYEYNDITITGEGIGFSTNTTSQGMHFTMGDINYIEVGGGSNLTFGAGILHTDVDFTVGEGRGIGGSMASNDYWNIHGGGSNDAGTLYIDTGDNGNEPIIFRQLGAGGAVNRWIYLMDGNGDTELYGLRTTRSTRVGSGNQYTYITDNWIGFYRNSDAARVGWIGANGSNHLYITPEKGNVYVQGNLLTNSVFVGGYLLSDWNNGLSVGWGSYNAGYSTHMYGNTILFKCPNGSIEYNGKYIDGNWSSGYFRPVQAGTALGGSGANTRWYRLYSANASSESSDERLKTNIADLDDRYIKFVELLRPIAYNWKNAPNDNKEAGLIAQEVQLAMQKCNITNKEFGIIDESGDYLSIIYRHMSTVLLKYVQHQKNQIDKLNNDLNKLEAKLDAYINNRINFKKLGGK